MQTEPAAGNAAKSSAPEDIVHRYFAALNNSDTDGITGSQKTAY
jgi:hypothetical protein